MRHSSQSSHSLDQHVTTTAGTVTNCEGMHLSTDSSPSMTSGHSGAAGQLSEWLLHEQWTITCCGCEKDRALNANSEMRLHSSSPARAGSLTLMAMVHTVQTVWITWTTTTHRLLKSVTAVSRHPHHSPGERCRVHMSDGHLFLRSMPLPTDRPAPKEIRHRLCRPAVLRGHWRVTCWYPLLETAQSAEHNCIHCGSGAAGRLQPGRRHAATRNYWPHNRLTTWPHQKQQLCNECIYYISPYRMQ